MVGDTVGIGEVIFISFKPIVKMAAVAGGGAIFAKTGLLTPEACKTNAAIIMNLLLPMLIFSTVLPAFDSKNMASVLSVVITSFFYQGVHASTLGFLGIREIGENILEAKYIGFGLCFGLIVRWLTPIPASWRGGVLAAGAFSNVGDLIIAYISTVAKSSPFNPEIDPARGTAYASILMVVQLVTIFNFGGYQLVKRDFDVPREPLSDTEKYTPARLNPEASISFADSLRKTLSIVSRIAVRKPQPCAQKPSETLSSCETILPITDNTNPTTTTTNSPKEASEIITSIPVPSIAENTAPTLTRRLWMIIRPFITPPSIALVLSLIIANVPVLKALFIKNPDIHMPQAPDQRPPLDFFMEIAVFVGPTVPVIGMLLLGAALSRLSMSGLPKGFWKAAVMMAGLKLVVGPIIGIAWTTGLTKETTWIPETDKILQLVMIIGSAAPTSTAQVYLTNMFAPIGPEGCVAMSALSAILLVQYGLMIITLTIAVCYTLMVGI